MPSAACASDRSGCLPGCTVAGSSEVVGNEVGERLPGGETPADAERVPSRVGVHLVTLIAVQILSWLEQSGAKGRRLFVGSAWVIDVKVEMHLLRTSVRPVRRDVVRRQLHADPPLARGVDDAMPRLVHKDLAPQHPSPERALSAQVGRVEHHHVAHEFHDTDATSFHR